jgi:hypothetical protein
MGFSSGAAALVRRDVREVTFQGRLVGRLSREQTLYSNLAQTRWKCPQEGTERSFARFTRVVNRATQPLDRAAPVSKN